MLRKLEFVLLELEVVVVFVVDEDVLVLVLLELELEEDAFKVDVVVENTFVPFQSPKSVNFNTAGSAYNSCLNANELYVSFSIYTPSHVTK